MMDRNHAKLSRDIRDGLFEDTTEWTRGGMQEKIGKAKTITHSRQKK